MTKSAGIIAGFIAVAIIGGVYLSQKSDVMPATEVGGAEEVTLVTGMPVPDAGSAVDEMVVAEAGKPELSAGSYEAYSSEKIAKAANGDVVLFFHASWCPSCRGLNSSIEKGVSSIPKGVTILKTNYDTETELKKKYGVTYQHTLVQVDKDGNLIKKWSGSSSLDALLAQVE